MTVLLRSGILRLCAGAAGALTFVGASEVEAQRTPKPCSAPSTVLIAFPKGDKAFATKNRDLVWSTFKDFGNSVCLVLRENVDDLLKNSSFPPDTVLGAVELVNLAQPLRADEILELEVIPVGRSVQFNGRVILTRDRRGQLRDSVPKHAPGEEARIAVRELLREFNKVQAMIELDKKCDQAARDEKFAEAEAAAREALKALPSSNIARLCLASVLREAKKGSADIIKLTDEVLAKDPKNEIALDLQLQTYLADNNQDKYADVGTRIIANSPTSAGVEAIIANLAQWKKTDIVIQLLEAAQRADPDNPNLGMIEFRILLAGDKLSQAQRRGEALAKLDSAVVDTVFVNRMVNAYARDTATAGSKEKAAEWLSRGTSKWPNDISYAMQLAQTLRSLGQTQQAVDEYKRVLKINPQAAGVRLQIANTYSLAGQTDSAFAWARRAVDANEDKSVASALAVTIANSLIKAAQDTTGGKTPSAEGFKKVIPYAAYADTLENPTGKFLWGLAAYYIANPLITSIQPPAQPTCPVLKEAREWIALANEKVLGGARAQPQAAGQLLPRINQMMEYVDGVLKTMKPPCPGT